MTLYEICLSRGPEQSGCGPEVGGSDKGYTSYPRGDDFGGFLPEVGTLKASHCSEAGKLKAVHFSEVGTLDASQY
jgi:hypothetical protein